MAEPPGTGWETSGVSPAAQVNPVKILGVKILGWAKSPTPPPSCQRQVNDPRALDRIEIRVLRNQLLIYANLFDMFSNDGIILIILNLAASQCLVAFHYQTWVPQSPIGRLTFKSSWYRPQT